MTDPAWDVAVTHALLRRVGAASSGTVSPVPGAGAPGAVLRAYRPQSRVMAFGRRDTRRPGFPAAVDAARAAGFAPVVRPQGGRAVAYTEHSLVLDHIHPHADTLGGMDERFATYGKLWARVLSEFGIDARIGEAPGEYCPGAYSVNARGVVKLVGTAQRVIKGAWLFSAVVIHDDADVLRPVLSDVYRALELPFGIASVGSIRKEAPGLSLDRLEDAVLAEYGASYDLNPGAIDVSTTDAAHTLIDDHRVP